eukprot:4681744-Pleurochrysis_carterae.AAC.1
MIAESASVGSSASIASLKIGWSHSRRNPPLSKCASQPSHGWRGDARAKWSNLSVARSEKRGTYTPGDSRADADETGATSVSVSLSTSTSSTPSAT